MKRLTFSNPAVSYDNCGLWQGKEKKENKIIKYWIVLYTQEDQTMSEHSNAEIPIRVIAGQYQKFKSLHIIHPRPVS